MTKTMVGSPVYMAPEVIKGKEYNSKAEIWSLGCVLFELLFGECPFEEASISKLIIRIDNDEIKYYRDVNPISKFTEELLSKMLVIMAIFFKTMKIKDPAKRIAWEELMTIELEKLGGTSPTLKRRETKEDFSPRRGKRKSESPFKFFLNERNKIYFLYKVFNSLRMLIWIDNRENR